MTEHIITCCYAISAAYFVKNIIDGKSFKIIIDYIVAAGLMLSAMYLQIK
jgi:hypothetical protein